MHKCVIANGTIFAFIDFTLMDSTNKTECQQHSQFMCIGIFLLCLILIFYFGFLRVKKCILPSFYKAIFSDLNFSVENLSRKRYLIKGLTNFEVIENINRFANELYQISSGTIFPLWSFPQL